MTIISYHESIYILVTTPGGEKPFAHHTLEEGEGRERFLFRESKILCMSAPFDSDLHSDLRSPDTIDLHSPGTLDVRLQDTLNPPKRQKIIRRKSKSTSKSKTWIRIKTSPQALLVLFVAGLFVFSTALLLKQGNTFEEAVYWSACSLTWSQCVTKIIYTPTIKILSIVNGLTTIVIVFMLLSILGEKFLGLDLRGIKMKKRIENLKGHFIVCGYGRVGEHVCTLFEENGIDYVVIEKRKEIVDSLKEKGVLAISGDATDPRNIEKAIVTKARGLVSTMGSDADNVFVVLAAKELNPYLTIASRAYSETAVKRLHKAGAEIVVLPEIVGGLELGKEILRLGTTYKEKLISREVPS